MEDERADCAKDSRNGGLPVCPSRRAPTQELDMMLERCPWYIAGPILGALIIALRATINKPLGALGGYIDVVDHAARPSRLGFNACVLAGIAIGGALFAVVTRTFSPEDLYAGLLPGQPVLQIAILGVAGL